MPSLLRIIRKNRWYKEEALRYLLLGDTPADPLADLTTENNALSVWYIEDDKSNLERVITALAATRRNLDVLDYALFDFAVPSEIKAQCERSSGNTPDDAVNKTWHYDLKELSGLKIVALTKAILEGGQKERVPLGKVRESIKSAVSTGQVDSSRMNPKLATALAQTSE